MKYEIDDQTLGSLVNFLRGLEKDKTQDFELIKMLAESMLGYINSDLVENGTDIDQLLEEML
jgi:hypothetical protein